MTEVTKILGARWKELSAEEKTPFEDMWKADKERFAHVHAPCIST